MPRVSLGTILDDFHARWQRGEAPRAEEYLDQLDSRDDAVALVYREYCLAEEAGLKPDPASYLSRFSELGPPLSRLFHLHEAFTASQLRAWCEQAPLPSAGDEIGPYFLVRELGRGAFGCVYLAQQQDLENRLVVVKVSTRVTQEPWMLARLHHPNIVDIHWHGDVNNGQFQVIVMPFDGGATLSAVLDELRREGRRVRAGQTLLEALDRVSAPERPALAPPRGAREQLGGRAYHQSVAWVVARLADALDHAYDRGVAHGDIKPSNILLTADGMPMLLDFNLAAGWRQHSFHEALDDPGGTLAYMAPERLQAVADAGHTVSSRPLDRHRADLYGLGIVLLEALTGRPPVLPAVTPASPRVLARALADVRLAGSRAVMRPLRAGIPPTLRAILARCLAPDPFDRYHRASELAEDLDRWLQDLPLKYAAQPALRPGPALWLRRHRIAVAIAALVTATALTTAYTRVVRAAARGRAYEHLLRYVDNSDSDIFRFRRYDYARVVQRGDPAENAWRHLADFGVDQPEDWRRRDDFYYLSAHDQDELQVWLAEQALRYGHAVADQPPSAETGRRALAMLERMAETVPAVTLWVEQQRLTRALGLAAPAVTPQTLNAPAWQQEYLMGVADELAQQEPRRELAHFQAVLRERPDSFWAHYRAATVVYRLHDYQSATDHLQYCLGQYPKNPALWVQFAGCLYQLGRFADALAACDNAAALDPSEPETYLSRSFVRQRMGQPEARLRDIREYERLARIHGDRRLGMRRLWSFPLRFDSPNDAHLWDDDLPSRILAIDPDDIEARTALASQLMSRGRIDRALAECDRILELCPDSLWARYARGSMRRAQHDIAGAREDFALFLENKRLEEFLREYPPAISAFHTMAAFLVADYTKLLWRADGAPLARAVDLARLGLRFADQLGAEQAESHYALARCLVIAAYTGRKDLGEAWRELAKMANCPLPTGVVDRFEQDSVFRTRRSLLRTAFAPWQQPRLMGN